MDILAMSILSTSAKRIERRKRAGRYLSALSSFIEHVVCDRPYRWLKIWWNALKPPIS